MYVDAAFDFEKGSLFPEKSQCLENWKEQPAPAVPSAATKQIARSTGWTRLWLKIIQLQWQARRNDRCAEEIFSGSAFPSFFFFFDKTPRKANDFVALN